MRKLSIKSLSSRVLLQEKKVTPLYSDMVKLQKELTTRVSELSFILYILETEKSDWSIMHSDLRYKIRSKTFTSERSEVENLLQVIESTVENYSTRLSSISGYLEEGRSRLRKINSAIASIDIVENIEGAVRGSADTQFITSRSELESKTEMREIKSLLYSTRALVELRQSK